MSETLFRLERERLAALWPDYASVGDTLYAVGGEDDLEERLADLETKRSDLEAELEELEDQISDTLAALGRERRGPKRGVTWEEVDDQLSILAAIAGQYAIPLPSDLAGAVRARAFARAGLPYNAHQGGDAALLSRKETPA